MAEAKRDGNYVPTLLAVSNADGTTPVTLYADPTTHRLLVSATAGALDDLSDVVITSGAQGDIIYHNGTNWVNLAAGTSGHFLKTQGAGANPTWAATASVVGIDTQVIFNDGGSAFAGDAGLVYNKTTDVLTVTGGVTLGSGGVISFNAGDVTITHGANVITVAGGDLALGANNLTLTGSIGATGARSTKVWATDIESTNMPTVGGTAILTSLTAPQFTTIELGHASDTTIARAAAGRLTVETVAVARSSSGSATDNTLARFDSTTGDLIQTTGIVVDDTNNVSSMGTLGCGAITSSGTLALGANSITMTGSIAATGARVTKGWFTDIESTNMPTVGGTAILTSLTAPQFTTIELGHASDTTISRVSAGVVAIEGSNIIKANTTATRTIVLTAAGGWASTTAGCAANTKVETTTNDMNYYTLDFDQTTEENAEWSVVMPDNYDAGTITAIFYWTAASGTGDVIWGIKARAFANDDALDQAFGTAVTVTDTLITAGDMHITAATSAVTIGGSPAGGQWVGIKCYRDADAGGDTLNADARLMAVKIEYGINAYTD